jgi:Cu(I)/Ag(I) efflux system membrane fusion protein
VNKLGVKEMKTIFNKKQFLVILISLLAGIFAGFLIFNDSNSRTGNSMASDQITEETIWTCSMHPQIRQTEPGLCPICAMELVPLNSQGQAGDVQNPNEILMSEAAVKLAQVQTSTVRSGSAQKVVYLFGKVESNEKSISELTARFSGRIEKLEINFTGQTVVRGQTLGKIYSPELISAQQELIEAQKYRKSNPALYNATQNKLLLWDITEKQIDEIEKQGKPDDFFEIISPVNGTVTGRHVAAGDYVDAGSPLFTLVDLSRVWVMFEAYEADLPWIKIGDSIHFTVRGIQEKDFTGRISYIDPIIQKDSRIARVRVVLNNSSGELKLGMFADGMIKTDLTKEGKNLLVPASAVLWTGKRSLVYTRVSDRSIPAFLQREVELGPRADEYYIVNSGLQAGEEVVTHAAFKVDAAAQLSGKSSMMNPGGGEMGQPAGHRHDMSQMAEKSSDSGHEMREESFRVEGNCSMCKDRIEKAALSLDGVKAADWGIESKQMAVRFDPGRVELMEIHRAIAAVGHNTDEVKAPDAVYEKLPACCLYRESGNN